MKKIVEADDILKTKEKYVITLSTAVLKVVVDPDLIKQILATEHLSENQINYIGMGIIFPMAYMGAKAIYDLNFCNPESAGKYYYDRILNGDGNRLDAVLKAMGGSMNCLDLVIYDQKYWESNLMAAYLMVIKGTAEKEASKISEIMTECISSYRVQYIEYSIYKHYQNKYKRGIGETTFRTVTVNEAQNLIDNYGTDFSGLISTVSNPS